MTIEHFSRLKNGAILCNAGHFDVEVNVRQLRESAVSIEQARPGITAFRQSDGRTIHLLAEGRLVNLAAGDGHPVEIMDMSFALQTSGILYLARAGRQLKIGVHNLPADLDDQVACMLLEILGKKTDQLSEDQRHYLDHWQLD